MTWSIPTPEEQVQFLRNIQRLLAEAELLREQDELEYEAGLLYFLEPDRKDAH